MSDETDGPSSLPALSLSLDGLHAPSLSIEDLPGVGGLLTASAADLMKEAAAPIRRIVDMPADVYRYVVQVPDERSVRDRLDQLGSDLLALVVPAARRLSTVAEIVPHGRYMQPILLGKIFGASDYVSDRRDALAALPQLPAHLRDELVVGKAFLLRHPKMTDAAFSAVPPADKLKALGDLDFYRAMAKAEWEATCERIDAHYRGAVDKDAHVERDLPIFRVAYAMTYHGLAKLDPVAGSLRTLTPGAITAYQRFATHRARMARLVEYVREAGVDPEVPEAVPDELRGPNAPRAMSEAGSASALPSTEALEPDPVAPPRDDGPTRPEARATALDLAARPSLAPTGADLPSSGASLDLSRRKSLAPAAAAPLETRDAAPLASSLDLATSRGLPPPPQADLPTQPLQAVAAPAAFERGAELPSSARLPAPEDHGLPTQPHAPAAETALPGLAPPEARSFDFEPKAPTPTKLFAKE